MSGLPPKSTKPTPRVWVWTQRAWAVTVAAYIGVLIRDHAMPHLIPAALATGLLSVLIWLSLAITAVACTVSALDPENAPRWAGTSVCALLEAGLLVGLLPPLLNDVHNAMDEIPALQPYVPMCHTSAGFPSGWLVMVTLVLACIASNVDEDNGRANKLCGALLLAGFFLAIPDFHVARERAGTRACYANQKTIVGAMEMYNLDKNTKRSVLDDGFFTDLVSGGYLQHRYSDPGCRRSSWKHYQATRDGNGITCTQHGSIQ